MDRLNYFSPYESKKPDHEDQLTRAFLVVLRHVPLAQISFLEMIRTYQIDTQAENIIPNPLRGEEMISIIKTQTTKIPAEDATTAISMLMTDKEWRPTQEVTRSDREARYDGVIKYGSYVIAMENKPRSQNIWPEQLCLALEQDSDIVVEKKAVVLIWADVISALQSLGSRNFLAPAESTLIQDFLEFVRDNFPRLNPYNRLHLCGRNRAIIDRRLRSILEEIAPGAVSTHQGGYARLEFPENNAVRMVWLWALEETTDQWEKGDQAVVLDLFPGDTVNQARVFYQSVDVSQLIAIGGSERKPRPWQYWPNLHFSFMSKNYVWADKNHTLPMKQYLEYWKDNIASIKQIKREPDGFQSYISQMQEAGLISQQELPELEKHFIQTQRQTMNVCPGIALRYFWPIEEAESLDKEEKFKDQVALRIQEALATWKQNFVPDNQRKL
jgi:hypothetical protein